MCSLQRNYYCRHCSLHLERSTRTLGVEHAVWRDGFSWWTPVICDHSLLMPPRSKESSRWQNHQTCRCERCCCFHDDEEVCRTYRLIADALVGHREMSLQSYYDHHRRRVLLLRRPRHRNQDGCLCSESWPPLQQRPCWVVSKSWPETRHVLVEVVGGGIHHVHSYQGWIRVHAHVWL